VRKELKALRDSNLDEATFNRKLDIISTMGIKVYPSEDLRSVRVTCILESSRSQTDDLRSPGDQTYSASRESEPSNGCRKVLHGQSFMTALVVDTALESRRRKQAGGGLSGMSLTRHPPRDSSWARPVGRPTLALDIAIYGPHMSLGG